MTSLWGCYYPHFASDGSKKWCAPGHRAGVQVPASLTPKPLFLEISHLSRRGLEPFLLWTLYGFPRVAITEFNSLSGLNNRHFLIVLEAGSPKSRCRPGCFPLRLVSLLCSHLSSSWVLIESSLCACLVGTAVRLGLVLLTSFYPNYLFRGSISKYTHILRYGGLGLQHVVFG